MTPCKSCTDPDAPMCDHWDICPEYQEFIKRVIEARESVRRIREDEPELYERSE